MVAAFLVLSAGKALTLAGEEHHVEREAHAAQQLEAELIDLLAPLIGVKPNLADLPGVVVQARDGGILAAFGDGAEVCSAAHGDRICVFQGVLRNQGELVEKCDALVRSPCSSRSSSEGGATHLIPYAPPDAPLNAAAVVLRLYAAFGSPLLAHLVGRFAFCMYDAQQVRVLAARDGSGAVPLLQARTPRGSLALASNPGLLARSCHDVVHFEPGAFKYGWQSVPRLFTPADAAPPHAMAAVRRSIEHHQQHTHHRRSGDTAGHRRSSEHLHHNHNNNNNSSHHAGQGSPPHAQRSSDGHPARAPGGRNGGTRRSMDTEAPQPCPRSPRTRPAAVSRPAGACVPAANVAAAEAAAAGSDVSALHSAVRHLNINAQAFVPSTARWATTS